ncbi:MAG TPA: hypothetical protein VNZ52_14255, partial [Candidatus Thermoplasmatota archaeon]|nr:hypothetical protein [Candidatus Thermoplasmatota archaeon]
MLPIAVLLALVAPVAAQGATAQDRGSVNLFLDTTSIQVEAEGKVYGTGVAIDSAAGNTTTFRFRVGLNDNQLRGPTNLTALLRLHPDDRTSADAENLTLNSTVLTVGPDS